MTRWRHAARAAAHALAAVAVTLCLLLPTSRYDWVSDVDPTASPADFAGGDASAPLVGVLAAAAILVELVAIATGRTRGGRVLPAVMLIAVAAAWGSRVLG